MKTGLTMKQILVLAALCCAFPAIAQIYKCKDGATTVFSAQPCAPNAQAVDVRPASGAGRHNPQPETAARPVGDSAGSTAERIRRQADSMQLERELKDAQALRDKLVRDREDELDALRRKKPMANNNLAGATWLQSISAEMQVVSDNYAERIRDVDARIAQYKAKVAGR